MSKKLLNEAQIRRFQSLANLPVVSEMAYAKRDEDLEEDAHKMEEEGHKMEEAAHEKEEGMHKEEMHEEMHEDEAEKEMGPEPMEPEMDMDAPSGDLDLSEEEARAIIDLGKKLEAIMAADEPEMDDMEADAAEMGAEDAMDMPGDMLEGVSVEPSRKEVVEEVARRVARRLNEAKRAQRRLNRALGNK
tara:strand:+ start:326 stop:892 length:567 start_codon:yes stop_codon:yes gene_type:complete